MSKETGRVLESGEACVFVEFSESGINIEFVVDTGFYGALTISEKLAEELKLKISFEAEINLFAERKVFCGVAMAEILWLGERRMVEVIINNGEDVLLGTEMLRGAILRINYQNRRLTVRN